MITVLAGGVGAARFLQGLVKVVEPGEVSVIINTGDDVVMHGLHVSPDIDTVTYTLAGLADEARGWGLKDETWECLSGLKRLGRETWFNLGDRDMALHIHRTERMREGASLSEVTEEVRGRLGVVCRLLPMSNERVATIVVTEKGDSGFQEYLVKDQAADRVKGIRFEGAEGARASEGALEAISGAEGVVIAPSNPIISIGPILAVSGVREALTAARARVTAISPIVGGKAIKGPAAEMLDALGHEASAYGVAEIYRPYISSYIMDYADAGDLERVKGLGVRGVVTDTIMASLERKMALARSALRALGLDR